ncbi:MULTISPECIES: type II toxin-antitoxin system RelE/ParE family toxin [unclassified Sphingomonas]|uniref:type II toxin-antitoxin system RelE/ParE family toxin n=1 Tax=unclassified Sphingomonas TaxID=196159 RepID=UPI00226A50A8|nr:MULTISPECIES: type II toxin-antitoxin system RelE/ParE family toxin [unclassified Sphingomonas]
MRRYRLLGSAEEQIDDILLYSRARWGEHRARAYIEALYVEFDAIAARRRPRRQLPAAFEIDGYFRPDERRFIYWHVLDDTMIGVGAFLHERMQQGDRLREVLG